MEVAATVAAHDFELAVYSFHDVGGKQRAADRFRVMEKGQVLQVPGRFDGPPALLKLGGIGFVEMSFVTLRSLQKPMSLGGFRRLRAFPRAGLPRDALLSGTTGGSGGCWGGGYRWVFFCWGKVVPAP